MDNENSIIVNNIKIDPIIFTFKFQCKCTGECCHYGVYTDLKEYKTILESKDRIIPLMDETQDKDFNNWFEEPEEDEDFESGVAVGTCIHNNKCVFLDKDGLCVLQRLALKEGVDQWKYKPHYCILFPFTIYENILTIDDEHLERLKTCNNQEHQHIFLFDHCQDELKHLFGESGYLELEKYRKEYLKNHLVEI
jgi:hypothetical protein